MVLDVRPSAAEPRSRLVFAADAVVGCATMAGSAARSSAGRVARAGSRLGRMLPRPPVLPRVLASDGPLAPVARRGREARSVGVVEADRLVRALVPELVDAVLEQLDLTTIVRQRVDVDAIVADVDADAVAARVDLDAVVARLDLVGLADMVVAGIDLPGIIRESSGSVASEAVRGVRVQSLQADDAVARVVGRLLPRRRRGGQMPEPAPGNADGSGSRGPIPTATDSREGP